MVRLEGFEPSANSLMVMKMRFELISFHKKCISLYYFIKATALPLSYNRVRQDALLFKFHHNVKDQLLDASLIVIYNLSALLIFSFFKQSSKENKSSIF